MLLYFGFLTEKFVKNLKASTDSYRISYEILRIVNEYIRAQNLSSKLAAVRQFGRKIQQIQNLHTF